MPINERIARFAAHDAEGHVKVMIIGLGSVGNYLLTYLLSTGDEKLEVVVAGRNAEKMQSDVNIALVSGLIRRECKSRVRVVGGVDLEKPDTVAALLAAEEPDFVVNTSRVYAGLKYGSISWANVRAYGIWSPLSIRYIRNIMEGYAAAGSEAIMINTSYSDATIPWLASAGKAYPDFGSGNLNHIVPRLRLGAAEMLGVSDPWNVRVDIATAHFHDVVISKEGQSEGVPQLIRVSYGGKVCDLDQDALLARCAIPMPVDQKRNMMNASSNFDIIASIVGAVRGAESRSFNSPGAFGHIGGYPVVVDGAARTARIDESVWSLAEMEAANRASIALDGVEDVRDGCLVYTDHLIEKAERAFGVTLPKSVAFDEIDEVAQFIIDRIIKPALAARA